MKCMLSAVPFDTSINNISAGIPILIGQLERAGIETIGIDFNAELYDYFFTEECIEDSLKQIECRKEELLRKSRRDKKEEKRLKIYDAVLKEQERNKNLIKRLPEIKKIIKEKEGSLKKEVNIGGIYKIIFAPYAEYAPWKHFSYNYNYAEIKRFSKDKENNIFYNFLIKNGRKYDFKQYDFIGISMLFEDSIYYAFTLGRYIKETAPNVKVILGGAIAARLWEEFSEFPEIFEIFCDNIAAGSADAAIVKYAEYAAGEISEEEVPGLLYKRGSRIKDTMQCISDINDAAPPSLNNIDLTKYSSNPSVSLQFSRGCLWNRCAFCTYAYPYTPVYSGLSAEKAANIIETIVNRHKIKRFYITDDFLRRSFSCGFAKEIIKRGLKIEYEIFMRFEDYYTQEIFDLIAESGCRKIFWGYEAASERVLGLMNKGIIKKDRNEILRMSKKAGIINELGIILGFPGETEEEIRSTIDFVSKNFGRTFDIFYASPFQLHKNSRIMKEPEKYGISEIRRKCDFSIEYNFKNSSIARERVKELCSECVKEAEKEAERMGIKAYTQHFFCRTAGKKEAE